MARTVAELPKGSRITDYISLGVLNTMIPRRAVDAALEASGRQSIRQRDFAGARDGLLRDRLGVVHAVVVSRGPALPAGGAAMVERPVGTAPGGRQVGYLASPDTLGGCTAASLA